MFFTGDASTRKRVDLGGRSSKERDRDKVLEQARRERNRRMELRRENASALKIQKCFRGRRATALARSKVRELFFNTYGHCCENMDRYSLHPDSEFLRQLVFFFNANNRGDCDVLVGACRKLLLYVNQNADFLSMLAGMDNSLKHTITYYRLKRFTYFCLQAVHQYRDQFKEKLLVAEEYPRAPTTILLEAVAILINPELPWVCNIVDYLANKNAYLLLQDIILSGMSSMKISESPGTVPPLEHVIILIASHTGHNTCSCTNRSPLWNFPSEILSIPFIWKSFPYLKEMFSTEQLGRHHIQQMAQHLYNRTIVLPDDTSPEFPGSICLLGNLLETATVTLSQPLCSHDVAVDFAAVASYLLETVPPLEGSNTDNYAQNENEMICDEENREILNLDLQNQIVNSIDSLFLETMVNSLFRDTSLLGYSSNKGLTDEELSATGAICYFLHVAFLVLPLEGIMTALAYRTEIVVILWNFIKWCHENRQWPSFSRLSVCLPRDAPGWLLPLAVFCPIYKHMLMIIDNEEFYEQQKPLSLKDIKCLVFILKLALWELIWVIPGNAPSFYKPSFKFPTCNKLSIDDVKYRVRIVTSELLNQLQDRNSRRAFMSPNDFHAPEAVGDAFISQALTENSRANDVLKHASFLVPFTSRVKIFMSQLTAARQRDSHHPAFTRYRFKIRRNQIFEDAFAQLSTLSEEQLRGTVRISFINELGEEEAGIDGGGLFKDFIESICRESFDVQYGLFKETNNHLLYPNPGSGLIHEQHLQFFHFLGTVLGKAMFEGILVDIPFATFFLSKLKQKHNYFNDLPSLDPELYRHLLFLKHYKGDVSELELYFVIVNNDYGEQTEEELVPGGKNKRVTKENVIMFIHLVANYRLNFQIRLQSIHFLRGFQQLIQKEWLDLFNEHEIQLLISGSSDGMDIADLRSHAQYSGGYHQDHPVILMFWEVIKSFSKEHQMKILKFVTGCSRGPLLGFKYLEPKFCIQRAAPADVTEEDLDRLPTSATCMNLLKLPPYRSKEQLRDKLMYAINAEAGFDLS